MDLKKVFHDVTPIEQDDGPNSVCAINYPDGFSEAMDYFRAMLDMNEHSGKCSAVQCSAVQVRVHMSLTIHLHFTFYNTSKREIAGTH